MNSKIHHELFAKKLLTEEQHDRIEEIESGRLVSVLSDLRALLYAGVLFFTTGIGILIYKNIGEIGHLVAMTSMTLLTVACFIYAFRKGPGYHPGKVEGPTPYFDYGILFGSLLFVSVQGYLQFRYDWLTDNLGTSTLISALFFFFIAYRFDHIGVLSLGITALASFFSITISPQKWYDGNFFEGTHVYLTAVTFGVALAGAALILDRRSIKTHFTFTYLNFALLIFFFGSHARLFMDEGGMMFYLLLIYTGAGFAYWMARLHSSFLFLIYAFIATYVTTTYLLSVTIWRDGDVIWFYYSILSCGGFVYFIVKYRNHFSRSK
jgi:hypothetical protein